jgi:hypothetical protein
MVFMVSLLGLPALGAELLGFVIATATGAGDAQQIGLADLRDNPVIRHRIYARNVRNIVIWLIDQTSQGFNPITIRMRFDTTPDIAPDEEHGGSGD